MKKAIDSVFTIAKSGTVKDTGVMFVGNVATAFLGFVFTWFLAKWLSIEEFGIFSAANNFIYLITAFTDLGTTNGLVRFVSEAYSRKEYETEYKFIKAGLVIKTGVTFAICFLLLIFADKIVQPIFATPDKKVAIWSLVIIISLIFPSYFTYVYQGQKKFITSAFSDVLYTLSRLIILLAISFTGMSLYKAFGTFAMAAIPYILFVLITLGTKLFTTKMEITTSRKLMNFSGWLGVNKLISAFSGRLDVQMLATMTGATAVGYYSIPQRLAIFIAMFAGSFSSVLAPRFSTFPDLEHQKKYLIKSTLAIIPISLGIVFWAIFAKPFMQLLFGEKFLPSVPVFQTLILANIPFIIATPAVSAIIYGIKKPKYIGIFSFVQIILIFFLNLFFIPRYSEFGPTYAFAITYSVLAVYMWIIVKRYYW